MDIRTFYLRYIDPRYMDYESAFTDFLREKKRVLDVGCGIGNFIAHDPKHIEGLDQNEASLKIARKRGFTVTKGQVTAMPFKDASFDGIFCGHVIEHLNSKDALKMLTEFHRILKRGGVMIIKTPLMYSRFYNDLTHVRPYPPEAIMDYLMSTPQTSTQRTADKSRMEFEILKLEYRYDFLYYPQLEPSRYRSEFLRTLITALKVCSAAAYQVGLRNYFVKNGYSIVLQKIS